MRALWDSRTPLRLAHLLLVAFPLGLAEFLLLFTGLVVGLASVAFFGLPLLVGLMLLWRELARFERRMLHRLLGVTLPDPYRALTAPTRLGRVRERLADPATWRDLAYLLLAFPLGLLAFTVTLTAVATTLGLLTAPLWAALGTSEGVVLGADTVLEGFALIPLGLLAALVTLAIVRGLSALYAAVARLFLTAAPDPELTSRVSALEDARARIIAAADAERRRLERDLHDGAQQRLVAVSLTLGMAKRRISRGEDASALVAQADADAREAIGELRDLARGLHPAILSHQGLAAAMEDLAARAPVPVEVVRAPAGRLPEPVEAGAYFIVAEALTNVAKYARATHVRVDASVRGATLELEVSDDGVGGAAPGAGTGLRGLADRVGALGGTLEVDSPAGSGTTLRAALPLGGEAVQAAAVAAPHAVRPVPSPAAVLPLHASAFAIVMTALLLVWLAAGGGYLWPQWIVLSWGGALALHAAVVAIDSRGTRLPRAVAVHAAAFAVVMLALVGVWSAAGGGYFWPQWPLIAGATLLAGHGWATQLRGVRG